jgi:uncharacterized protein (TIGR02145 family)
MKILVKIFRRNGRLIHAKPIRAVTRLIFYPFRSMGGTWWMIQNADKPVSSGCANESINRDSYGYLYSWDCAEKSCPPGWELPSDNDFRALHDWLTIILKSDGNDRWDEWNSGSALAGYGHNGSYYDNQGLGGCWWSSSSSGRCWGVDSDNATSHFGKNSSHYSFSVRCRKYHTEQSLTMDSSMEPHFHLIFLTNQGT